MSTNKIYFKNLDSIRFIAAMMVFLDHSIGGHLISLTKDGTFLHELFTSICNGPMGVSIFFVLSGFLITFLLISEYEIHGNVILKDFYLRRVLRIWPLYYAVVIFLFFLSPFLKSLIGYTMPPGHLSVFYQLSFLSNFDILRSIHKTTAGDGVTKLITWSVSIEEQFYLLWPLVFTFLPKRLWGYLITSVIIISLCFRIIHHDQYSVLHFHTLSVLMDLGIGGFAAYLIKTNFRVRKFFESVSTPLHLFFFLFSISLILCYNLIGKASYGLAIGRVFTSVSFALIIASQAMTTKDSIFNLGKLSFANKWGKYTYGIYLIHPIVLSWLDSLSRYIHIPISTSIFGDFLIGGVVGFCLTLLISWISYTYFESKFLALKSKFTVIKTRT